MRQVPGLSIIIRRRFRIRLAKELVARIGAEGVIRHLADQDGGSRSALRTYAC